MAIPLTFGELKAQPVEHQLVLVGQDGVCFCFLRSQLYEFVQGMDRHVLVYRPAMRRC